MTARIYLITIVLGSCLLTTGCHRSKPNGEPKAPEGPTAQIQVSGSDTRPPSIANSDRDGSPNRNLPDGASPSWSKERPRTGETVETRRLMLSTTLPKLGRWVVKGKDLDGNEWEAALVFTENIEAGKNAGYFDWKSDAGSGREHFFGIYDDKTKAIRWTGHRIENAVGRIAHANYSAVVSSDKLRLTQGQWDGNGVVPGSWTAEWKAAVE